MYNEDDYVHKKTPKRFLWLFCHEKEVGNTWGCGFPFWIGIIILSSLVGILSFYDIPVMWEPLQLENDLYRMILIIRILPDIINLIGIVAVIISFCNSSYNCASFAYYSIIMSFIINTIFLFLHTVMLFISEYRNAIGIYCIPWFFEEILYFILCWFLFCNMADINKKKRRNLIT